MTLAEQIQTDIVVAMKARDDFKLSVLRMVKSAIPIEGSGKTAQTRRRRIHSAAADHFEATKRIHRTIHREGNQPELAEKGKRKSAIIEQYLPAGASAQEEMNCCDR